jgi:hypothetical protein
MRLTPNWNHYTHALLISLQNKVFYEILHYIPTHVIFCRHKAEFTFRTKILLSLSRRFLTALSFLVTYNHWLIGCGGLLRFITCSSLSASARKSSLQLNMLQLNMLQLNMWEENTPEEHLAGSHWLAITILQLFIQLSSYYTTVSNSVSQLIY